MLTDEEIIILYNIHKMTKAYNGDGVPHKRLFAYMKETNQFKKSDSSLKRILLGDRNSGRQGFKEKVPGFTFEKIEVPQLDEKGLEIKGAGKTRALCYSYDGDLFDNLPENVKVEEVVSMIKKSTFVECEYEIAEALELEFRVDPDKVNELREDSDKLDKWKREYRNQKNPSEISRNQQKSNDLNSATPTQPIPNNNNKTNNNNSRNHEMEDKGDGKKHIHISSMETKKGVCVFPEGTLKTVNSVNSVNSASHDSDHGLNSACDVVNSVNSASADDDCALNSDAPKIKTPVDSVNSDIVSLLKRSLTKFAWDEYKGFVPDLDEFVRMFNAKVPDYKRSLGKDAIGYNAAQLHMRGWR